MIEGLRQIAETYQFKPLVETIHILQTVSQTHEAWDIAIEELAANVIRYKYFDQLQQLVIQGPVFDGDVISKSDRSALMGMGLAERVMYRGEWGYSAATYCGGFVLKACFVSPEAYNNYIKSKLK